MSTGIETWNQNLLEIGPMYPFPGIEGLLAIVGIATWILWHVIQLRRETQVYDDDEERMFNTPEKLSHAMDVSMAQTQKEMAAVRGDDHFGSK